MNVLFRSNPMRPHKYSLSIGRCIEISDVIIEAAPNQMPSMANSFLYDGDLPDIAEYHVQHLEGGHVHHSVYAKLMTECEHSGICRHGISQPSTGIKIGNAGPVHHLLRPDAGHEVLQPTPVLVSYPVTGDFRAG